MSRNSLSSLLLGCGTLVLGLGVCGTAGCGDADPARKLEAAGRALSEARASVEQARARVAERSQDVEAAEKELAEARKELERAEQGLRKVEEGVDLRATDTALFRAVQSRLIEDKSLEQVAIAARVEKGVVVLLGQVSDAKLRDRAVEIARSTPGVASVENRIDVVPRGAETE